jgi:hypothetical protein
MQPGRFANRPYTWGSLEKGLELQVMFRFDGPTTTKNGREDIAKDYG